MQIPSFIKSHYALTIVSIAFLIFSLYFSSVAIHKHKVFHTHYYDLGIMDQIIYNTSRGHFMELTDPFGKENIVRSGLHNDLLLAVFAPLYWVFSSVSIILLLQVLVVATGALALYEIGAHLKHPVIGAFVGVVYLLYPPLQWEVLYEFHAVTFATPLLLWGWFFLLTRQWRYMWLFFILALLSKEQVGFTLGWSMSLGSAYLFFRHNPRFSKNAATCSWGALRDVPMYMGVGIISIAWSLASFLIIIPHFGTGTHFAIERFSDFGSSPIEVVRTLLNHPDLLIERLFSEPVRKYVSLLLGPLGGVPLLAPILLLGAWPDFFINVISSSHNMVGIIHQYTAVITPYIFLALCQGLILVKEFFRKKYVVAAVSIFIGISSIWHSALYSPLPYSARSDHRSFAQVPYYGLTVTKWAARLEDDTISVAASDTLAPHFSQRRRLLRFSSKYEGFDYVILLRNYVQNDWYDKKDSMAAYNALIQDPNYLLVDEDGDLEVYKRID